MTRLRVPLSLLVLAAAVGPVFAADDGKDDTDDPVHGQTRSDAQPTGPSSHMSRAILSSLPAYDPNPPEPKKKPDLPEGMSEDDVVVMKTVHVRERKQPRVQGWEMLTEEGMKAFLKEKYPGASPAMDSLGNLTYNYAKLMSLEDIRLEHLKELQNNVDAQRAAGNTEEWKELNKVMLDAKMRPNDWAAESMDQSANNGRR